MGLYSMIEVGGRMKFEVTAEDLVTFADHLIAKAISFPPMQAARRDTSRVA